jgi:cell division septum initiation protein DivIVA
VDVHDKLNELADLVENARAMPMSASCMVNRSEVLDLIDEIRELLPAEFRHAERLLEEREAVIAEGRVEAERLIAAAKTDRDKLIERTEVMREAQVKAEAMRSQTLREAAALRREVDDYVDTKLANFEVVLDKTLTAVQRGREKLRGRDEMDHLGEHVRSQDAPLDDVF